MSQAALVPPEPDLGLDGMPMRFGKYTLIRKLAMGGMAELFLAIQKSVAGFEKLLVIKRILPSMNQDRAFIDMLLHEARIAATLSHPNIVQIFDVGQEQGQYFIAMEHVHGEDLRSIVRQMKKKDVTEFPLEHALAIVLGMCAGLAYAHEKRGLDGTHLGIVHRDISPQNIVVTFTGDVKIVDFGIAQSQTRIGEQTKSGKLKGKVPYMSPEQARGEPIDARSDVFAMGTMLFELTTGKRLFKGQSEYETLKLICDREYPRPTQVNPHYPPDLEAVVMRALTKDANERYQSARAMQADLESFVRRHQIAVSSLALNQFMQSLFEEKLAVQKEALLQGKHLADIIEMQRVTVTSNPDLSGAFDVDSSGQRASTTSNVSASQTVTGITASRAKRSKTLALAGAFAVACTLGGLGYLVAKSASAPAAALPVNTSEAAKPTRGTLVVTSDPPGASIWINGDLRAEVTPTTIKELPTGVALDVKLTMDGYEQAKQKVTLKDVTALTVTQTLTKAAVVADVKATAEPAPPAKAHEHHHSSTSHPTTQEPVANGKLNVGASGGWCDVTIDGTSRGATPIAGVELPAGPHKLTCTTADGKVLDATVTVSAGDTARFKFAL